MDENKPYRKYPVCQKCGGEFTDEHKFAKYCKKCNPKAVASGVRKITPSGERLLTPQEFSFRYHEYSIAIICTDCNREIDVISGKTQPFEAVCPGCGKHYEPIFTVKEIRSKHEK